MNEAVTKKNAHKAMCQNIIHENKRSLKSIKIKKKSSLKNKREGLGQMGRIAK